MASPLEVGIRAIPDMGLVARSKRGVAILAGPLEVGIRAIPFVWVFTNPGGQTGKLTRAQKTISFFKPLNFNVAAPKLVKF